jgi:hypothetical protein
MERLEIFDLDQDGALLFDLKSFLALLPSEFHRKKWNLFCIEAQGTQGTNGNILEIEERAHKQENGLELTWASLLELVCSLDEIINLELIGSEPEAKEPKRPFDRRGYTGFVVLEVIDSSLWAVETDLEELLNLIKRTFSDVRSVRPE